MPLSDKDVSDIAKEFAATYAETADTKLSIPNTQEQITKKQEQTDRLYVPYNNSNIERVVPYQVERRWLNGTTYVDITQSQIDDAALRTTSNIFFPSSWTKSNAMLTANGNGNPTTISSGNESDALNASVANQGLISQIGLLINGQSSGVPNDTLTIPYAPGSSSIEVSIGAQTIGKLLYISGSGTSAVVLVTNVAGTTLQITEVIPPAGTISDIGSLVVESIPGFTNGERQSLTSAGYQRILTELTNRILVVAATWKTALDNQYGQLLINIDNPSQIATAKTNINTAVSAYNVWFALPNTGASGKFTDTSLANLASAYNTRNPQVSTRNSQIVTALGSVSQDGNGDYSGSGQYLQRFQCLNFLINSANGAQFQLNTFKSMKVNSEQKIATNANKLATLNNLVRCSMLIADSVGTNTIIVSGAAQFSISDEIMVVATDLPTLRATITAISGSNVTLNITVPKTYTKAAQANIVKRA
jgi:hypothetical protein